MRNFYGKIERCAIRGLGPTLTGLPQPEPSHDRDGWKPIPRTRFNKGSMGGDDGIRRVLEMVCAAVRE